MFFFVLRCVEERCKGCVFDSRERLAANNDYIAAPVDTLTKDCCRSTYVAFGLRDRVAFVIDERVGRWDTEEEEEEEEETDVDPELRRC